MTFDALAFATSHESDVRAAGRAVEAYLNDSRAQFGHNVVELDEVRENLSQSK